MKYLVRLSHITVGSQRLACSTEHLFSSKDTDEIIKHKNAQANLVRKFLFKKLIRFSLFLVWWSGLGGEMGVRPDVRRAS